MTGIPAARRRPARVLVALAGITLVLSAATGCAADSPGAPSGSPSPIQSQTLDASPSGSPSPSPSATADSSVPIPTDCRSTLSAAVLDQLAGVPLNDPAFGPSGVQPDGSLRCIWADPAADTTGLTTDISRMASGAALDMLNGLADTEGYTCYKPDVGTRCEKEWQNATYPVTDGRTLYFRDDILIDTMYSNLAPTGYTSSIVASIWG
ncbi:MAG TPA: hypothetical protein VNT50_10650 [Microbacterium sp.]|uniref:hypothetical protein n=1 Tax=Microbacterium sp. TaxID=51671 RepID=UPI002CA068CD|nr:hypothetical protein [Microbacterium sp.]HWI31941.1 hypothetical protein [Microbacterium sp.]